MSTCPICKINTHSPASIRQVHIVWNHLKRDTEHNDRRQTDLGTKSRCGLAACFDDAAREAAAAKQPANAEPTPPPEQKTHAPDQRYRVTYANGHRETIERPYFMPLHEVRWSLICLPGASEASAGSPCTHVEPLAEDGTPMRQFRIRTFWREWVLAVLPSNSPKAVQSMFLNKAHAGEDGHISRIIAVDEIAPPTPTQPSEGNTP